MVNTEVDWYTIYLFTEDSAADAQEVIEAIVRSLIRHLGNERGCPIDLRRVRFIGLQSGIWQNAKGNRWKALQRRDRISIHRDIAGRVATSNALVIFHCDGDVVWENRRASANVAAFEGIRAGIQSYSEALCYDAEQVARLLSRVVPLIPFWEIESWLYQNTRAALEACETASFRADVPVFESWSRDRALLDEVESPKDTVSLGARANLRLATQQYPVAEVVAAGKSLAAALDALRACSDLMPALEQLAASRTYPK